MPINETGFIEKVTLVADNLDTIGVAATLFDEETVTALSSISDLELDVLVEDLGKSNYLGNRKIDIDLTLNNLSTEVNVAYQQADVLLKTGAVITIPFYTTPGDAGSGITELTSHADIKNYIANDSSFIAQVTDNELTVEPAIGIYPEVIRFRDSDGQSSNIDRVTLEVFSGTPVDTLPKYYWAKTTSSLQTIANRVSDIIKLGDDIDNIIALSNLSAEITALNAISTDITTTAGIEANIVAVSGAVANIQRIVDIEVSTLDVIVANEANMDSIVATVIPNMAEILLADDNAAAAAASAAEASNVVSGISASEGNSEDSSLESEDWSSRSEDTLTRTFDGGVGTARPAGNYSALHYSAKAATSASSALGNASAASTSETNAGTSAGTASTSATNASISESNASTSAINAGTSETNAGTSEVASEDSNLESGDWANLAENILTRTFASGVPTNRGAGSYSALHYSAKSATSSIAASTSASDSSTSAGDSASSEASALAHLNAITALTAAAQTLVEGSSASASYNSATGVLTLGVPVGAKGDQGDSFTVDASGPIASRSAYDGSAVGFSYLSTDEVPTQIYFKNSSTPGDWSAGVDFGKGETGDTGAQGLGWYAGSGVPSDGTGSDGEFYLDTANGDVYEKVAGSWGAPSTNLAASINDVTATSVNSYSSNKVVELLREKITANDITSSYVVSGMLPITSADLTSSISAGTAYIVGKRTTISPTAHTYVASKDTYVDLANTGVFTFVEVANGAGVPAVTALTIRLAKVVTDGTTISTVEDLRQTSVVIDGRQVSTDGTKLDTIETNATADQSDAEIRAAVSAATDSNVYNDDAVTKLGTIETSANNYSHPNHTGDVTSVADGTQTIAGNAVSLAKMAQMPTASLLGRSTASTGNPEVLDATTVRTILNIEDGATANQTTEEIQDIAGPLVATGGTKTGIAVTYDDANGDIDFVVNNATALGNLSGTNSGDEASASLTVAGVIELATGAETNTSDATRAVTPDGLTFWTGSAAVTTLGTVSAGTIPTSVVTDLSGVNTGDQTITLTGDATGSGTGSFVVTVVDDSHVHTPTTITGLSGTNTGDETKASVDALNVDADTVDSLHGVDLVQVATTSNLTAGYTTDIEVLASDTIAPNMALESLKTRAMAGNLTINFPSGGNGICHIILTVDASDRTVTLGANVKSVGLIPTLVANGEYMMTVARYSATDSAIQIQEIS